MAIRINSSLVPEEQVDDSKTGPDIVHTPVPSNIKWPQWVNNSWQEYSLDNDPMVIAARELEASYENL